jgi:hypothetical protein
MLDLSKWSKRWLSNKNKYLVRIDDKDMIIYALISKDCKQKQVIKTIIKPNYVNISKKG